MAAGRGRHLRARSVATRVLLAGLLLPAVFYGWQGNLHEIAAWYRTVTDTSAPNLLVPENISLATMWAKWIGVGPLAARLAIATGVAALAVVGLRRSAGGARSASRAISSSGC